MEKFCGCTSKWSLGFIKHSGQETLGADNIKCSLCFMYYWNDAWYENMMQDLKFMNS